MEHDHSDKLLFSYGKRIADLLRDLVTAPWVHTVDVSPLERVPNSNVGDDLREREADIL